MDMKTYVEHFQSFGVYADKQAALCTRMDEYCVKLSEISQRAVLFYTQNSLLGEPDYQNKINVFLQFDNYLKDLKRKFAHNLEKKVNRATFFSQDRERSRNEAEEPLLQSEQEPRRAFL